MTLFGANFIKFFLPTLLMLIGLPKIDSRVTIQNQIGVFDSMSFAYELQYPVKKLEDPVIDVLDYTDDWQFMPKPITDNEKEKYRDIAGLNWTTDLEFNRTNSKQETVTVNLTSALEELVKFGDDTFRTT